MTKEEMANLIEQSAELGAKKALRDIGFSDDDALLTDVSVFHNWIYYLIF